VGVQTPYWGKYSFGEDYLSITFLIYSCKYTSLIPGTEKINPNNYGTVHGLLNHGLLGRQNRDELGADPVVRMIGNADVSTSVSRIHL
jgi:hypothetical protein